MKKIISLLLALLMTFSVATVAFATEGEANTDTSTETTLPEGTEDEEATDSIIPDLGEYNWILDLPFWTVGPALKFGKIAFKLISVYLKVAKIFGLVEQDMDDMILDAIGTLLEGALNGDNAGEEVTEPSTEPAAVLA